MIAFWTRPAQADLAAIDDWYADINPDFAARVGKAAVTAAAFLADHPEAGEEVRSGVRRWHVRRTPYLLLYRIALGRVEILHVRHERQDRPQDL